MRKAQEEEVLPFTTDLYFLKFFNRKRSYIIAGLDLSLYRKLGEQEKKVKGGDEKGVTEGAETDTEINTERFVTLCL